MSDRVTNWLEQLGLIQYAALFEENAIELEHLPELDHETVKEIGVQAVGHRMTILKVATNLKARPDDGAMQATDAARPTVPHNAEAERRQLTVMFCDLVGSTELAQQLDPEDLREVNRVYQDACKVAIERYEGYVARYMGDGVLAYFGYPQAHEDDAERAIHAGLGLIEAMDDLKRTLGEAQGVDLDVRVGIATGPVVVGDLIGEGASQESAVVGETPNLAARLQTLADSNSVVVSPSTFELSTGQFEFLDLGEHQLKGIAEPISVWKALAPIASSSRFEASHRAHLTRLVGREHEVGLLLDRWSQAKEGDGQVVIVSGEAGIGKSRLIETLRLRSADDNPIRMRFQCSPFHANSSLYPVIVQLEQAMRFTADDPPATRLDKLEAMLGRSAEDAPERLVLFASLLSIPIEARYPPLELGPDQQKEKTLDALVARIEEITRQQTVLMLFEDMHWADPTTIELMDRLVERIIGISIMVVITNRPEFTPPWTGQMNVTFLTLNRLGRRPATEMVNRVAAGKVLPDDLREHIVSKTDGIPLFVEELTKTVLESDLVTQRGDTYELTGPLSTLEIPSTLHDSLMARLDRTPQAKGLAQTAAALGREFSHEMLAAVSSSDQSSLESALEQLLRAELVFPISRATHPRYGFKHALVQDAAYASMLKKTRRALHERIATVIGEQFPETVQNEPEVLAHHYTAADLAEPASRFWLLAGNRAMERSADLEAVAHLRNGLAALDSLPASEERDAREFQVQTGLFRSLTITEGWGTKEALRSHERVRELGERVGDTQAMLTVLVGDRIRHWTRSEYTEALEVADKLVQMGDELDGWDRSFGELLRCWPSLALGEVRDLPSTAQEILDHHDAEKTRLFNVHYGIDLRVAAWSVLSYHHSLCGTDTDALSAPGKRRSPLDDAWARLLAGWAIGKRGDRDAGIRMLEDGLGYLFDEGVRMFRSLHLGLLAEIFLEDDQPGRALKTLGDAQEHIERTGERVWEAEIFRLRGRALFATDNTQLSQARDCFERAVAIADSLGMTRLQCRAEADLTNLQSGSR